MQGTASNPQPNGIIAAAQCLWGFGYQNLLVPVIGFYLIAFVLQRRRHA